MDTRTIVLTISTQIKALREERGLSLQEVADRAGLAKSHVWELEQGRSINPTIATAVGIARALGTSLDHLAGLTTAEPALHPEAMRIACEVDALLRRVAPVDRSPEGQDA